MNLTLIKSFLPDFNIDQFCMFEKIISLDWKPVFDEESVGIAYNYTLLC